jgi:hypothetical protein
MAKTKAKNLFYYYKFIGIAARSIKITNPFEG